MISLAILQNRCNKRKEFSLCSSCQTGNERQRSRQPETATGNGDKKIDFRWSWRDRSKADGAALSHNIAADDAQLSYTG